MTCLHTCDSDVEDTMKAHGPSIMACTRLDNAWRRLAPPTSTDNFLAALLYPTCKPRVRNNRTTPPWKNIRVTALEYCFQQNNVHNNIKETK